MRIKWYGTATILLESATGSVLIDPYLKNYHIEFPKAKLEELEDVAAILITHPHFDHFLHSGEISKVLKAPIYVCKRGIEIAKEQLFPVERYRECKVGDFWYIGDMKVTVYQGKHCKFDFLLLCKKHFDIIFHRKINQAREVMKTNRAFSIKERDILNYLIEVEGKSIFVIGSANIPDQMEYPTGMDLLVFPYQGRSRMEKYAMEIIKRLQPKAVFLDHFDDAFPPISEEMDCSDIIKAVKELDPVTEIVKPVEGKWYYL